MKKEFDQHPLIDLLPDRAYSPASVAKAYMQAMGIELPKEKFRLRSGSGYRYAELLRRPSRVQSEKSSARGLMRTLLVSTLR